MKLSYKILGLFLGLSLFPMLSQAQVYGIIDYAVWDEDNAVIGDTTIITVHVKFKSASTDADTAVNGNLYYHYQTDSMISLLGQNSSESLDDYFGWEVVPPGGKFDSIYFPCLPNQLRTGPVNVIIIWPALFNPLTPMEDSVHYVLVNCGVHLAGVTDEDYYANFGSTVYPNPAMPAQIVFINSKYAQQIEKISIINAMGQMLNSKEFMQDENSLGYVLPTEELRPGIYHIQILYKDKKTEVVKFIKN